jgi:chromosome segregation ATPase
MPCRRCAAILVLALACLLAACGEPPEKEMNQARGAIAAARAAGAEQYAGDEYQAAVAALQKSEDAVTQRDYRQALSYALDSRERAENAAHQAADQKAQARSEAERGIRDLQAAITDLAAHLKIAESARPRRRDLAEVRRTMDNATAVLDNTRAMLAREDYGGARTQITAAIEQVRAEIARIDAGTATPKGRKGR